MDQDPPVQSTSELPPTSQSLSIVLMRARESVMAPIRKMLTESGITEQQWRILRVLSEVGPQDASRLADRACLLLSSLTRISRTMVEKGYIKRVVDPKDRRRYTVWITPKGQKIIDENRQMAVEIASKYREKLGTENFETLLDLLEQLHES